MSFSRFLIVLIPAGFFAFVQLSAFTPTEDGLYAVFDTTEGEFTTRLHYEKVPMTVASFVGLAENSISHFNDQTQPVTPQDKNFYDGIIFHRVIAGFVIQGGSPLGTGTDGPGYQFADEIDPTLKHDKKGVLSMANSGPNSNGSQFFVTLAAASGLDGLHSVFGEVVDGMAVVDAIGVVPVNGTSPIVDVVINSVTIVREGAEAIAFAPTDFQREFSVGELVTNVEATENGDIVTSFEKRALGDYFVQASSNLVDWSSPVRLFSDENDDTRVAHRWMVSEQAERLYHRFTELGFPWAESMPGSSIEVVLPESSGGTHVIDMGASLNAEFASDFGTSEIYYEWYDMKERVQLYYEVLYNSSNWDVIQVHFAKSDLNSGPAFVRIRYRRTNQFGQTTENDVTFETTFEYTPAP